MTKCKHCNTPIEQDTKGHWRHTEWVSWCRSKAVGPGQECWCGADHSIDPLELMEYEFITVKRLEPKGERKTPIYSVLNKKSGVRIAGIAW